MAAVTPLGIRRPAGLEYLIAEGVLPTDPSPQQYSTRAYIDQDCGVGEEILQAKGYVTYARGGYVRRVWRFDEADGDVQYAELSCFSTAEERADDVADFGSEIYATTEAGAPQKLAPSPRPFGASTRTTHGIGASRQQATSIPQGARKRRGRRRALAIFVGTTCHVAFLDGPTHTLDVPFEVESIHAFQAGLIIQRRVNSRPKSAGAVPRAPPNSFRASQSQVSHNGHSGMDGAGDPHLHLGGLHPGNFSSDTDEVDYPRFLVLSDPLAGFTAVASATIAPLPRHLRLNDTDLLIEYDDFDDDERLIYVSGHDELTTTPSAGIVAPLLLFVTINERLSQLTVWQGWSLQKRPMSLYTTMRRNIRTSRVHRRSSNANVGNFGDIAPAVRFHEKGRESFAATAHVPGKRSARKRSTNTRKSVHEDDAAAMALRLDPQYQFSQQSLGGPRRAGSMLSRGDFAGDQHRGHAALGAGHAKSGRKGGSFRASLDRASMGASIYRKSRGSVAGSVFSRSLGPDDNESSMDLDLAENNHEMERALQLYLATNDLSPVPSAFTSDSDGDRPGFIARKVHVHGIPAARTSQGRSTAMQKAHFKVCTTFEGNAKSRRLSMFVHDKAHDQTIVLNFGIVTSTGTSEGRTSLPAELPGGQLPVPIYQDSHTMASQAGIAELHGSETSAVIHMLRDGHLEVALANVASYRMSLPSQVRVYDRTDVRTALSQNVRDVGMRRIVPLSGHVCGIAQAEELDTLLLSKTDGSEVLARIKTEPHLDLVRRSLAVMKVVLPTRASLIISNIWQRACQMLGEDPIGSIQHEVELEALFMTILAFAIGSLRSGSSRGSRHSYSNARGALAVSGDGGSRQASKHWSGLIGCASSKAGAVRSRHAAPHKTRGKALSFNTIEANTRRLLHDLSSEGAEWLLSTADVDDRAIYSLRILLSLQLLRQDMALSNTQLADCSRMLITLAACSAQLGHYLALSQWSWSTDSSLLADFGFVDWDFSSSTIPRTSLLQQYEHMVPFTILQWLEEVFCSSPLQAFPTLDDIGSLSTRRSEPITGDVSAKILPRLHVLTAFVRRARNASTAPAICGIMQEVKMTRDMLEDLPDDISAYLHEFITKSQSRPPSVWPASLLQFVGRDDVLWRSSDSQSGIQPSLTTTLPAGDVHAVASQTDRPSSNHKSHVADRNVVSAQLFSEDRRLIDAGNLLNPAALQVAECPPQPTWSDIEHLDEQKRIMAFVMRRTIALPAGNALLLYGSQKPLLSEKFHVPGFSMQCQMKPMDTTISADRTGFTEEKLSWAFFHAGTSAGLNISRRATGIDTSWILFNKPAELTNRHAGFLFALGLNGHLRPMVKWLAFKYLTPKHTMTSIGLLLGLSASHLGTMDTLITRMLSVHITRMLPPGAAELNVSGLTQTAGLIGIGLLYHNTQHRRMSEIMLSELEHRDLNEASSAADVLRDESYRLAAGIALGLMNLGKGDDLQGLQGMSLLERLLSIAAGPRPVELVHIVDKATAGSILAVAFIYMKTNDLSIASKIDVPATTTQLEHVRPDIILLRTLAKNLIMWDSIKSEPGWIQSQLGVHGTQYRAAETKADGVMPLRSVDIPFYNIITGHAWSLSIKYAGSASEDARDEVLEYLDMFWQRANQDASYYDAQLTKTTLRRCIDVLALAAATIMAGSGDLVTSRYLRRLHGRTDAETTYGSHMAAHLAMGALFLGGGTHTFSTSNIAIAALVTAFYPLFPNDVHDNAVHLQALRHLWVLAAEPRCAVCKDVDSGRVVPMQMELMLRSGELKVVDTPCLLPDLATIASLETLDSTYWKIRLDLQHNKDLLARIRDDQTIFVRKAQATRASALVFSQTLMSMNEKLNMPSWFSMWAWLFDRPIMQQCIDQNELDLVLPVNERSSLHVDGHATVLDSKLTLWRGAKSADVQRLRAVGLVLQWARKKRLEGDGRLEWLGDAFVERLQSVIEERMGPM